MRPSTSTAARRRSSSTRSTTTRAAQASTTSRRCAGSLSASEATRTRPEIASLEVEDLLEPLMEARCGVGQRVDERCHLSLPSIVDGSGRHRCPEGVEVLDLEVAEQLVAVDENRIVAGARGPKRVEHLGPDGTVPATIFRFLAGQEAHREPDAFHGRPPDMGSPGSVAPGASDRIRGTRLT